LDQTFRLVISSASLSASVVDVAGMQGFRWISTPEVAVLPEAAARADASTTQAPDGIVERHTTSATAAAGFGLTDAVELQSAEGTLRRVMTDVVSLVTATDGAEVAQRVISVMASGALAQALGITAN